MEQSGRAKALYTELRATREVGALARSSSLRMISRNADSRRPEKLARAGRPIRQRLGAFVSIVASYTMRPQLGMAAVLLLMVGSSLLLLRVKPGAPSAVQVTERGVPESDKESVAVPVPRRCPPAPSPPMAEPRRNARQCAVTPRRVRPPKKKPPRRRCPGALRPRSRRLNPATPLRVFRRGSAPYDALDEGASSGHGSAAFAPAACRRRGSRRRRRRRRARRQGGAAGCAASLPHYEALMANPPSAAAGNAARLRRRGLLRAARSHSTSARRQYTALLSTPATPIEPAKRCRSFRRRTPARRPRARPPQKPRVPRQPHPKHRGARGASKAERSLRRGTRVLFVGPCPRGSLGDRSPPLSRARSARGPEASVRRVANVRDRPNRIDETLAVFRRELHELDPHPWIPILGKKTDRVDPLDDAREARTPARRSARTGGLPASRSPAALEWRRRCRARRCCESTRRETYLPFRSPRTRRR